MSTTTDSGAPHRHAFLSSGRPRVLVAERIGESGQRLLAEHCEVLPEGELSALAHAEALIVRSATAVDTELMAKAPNLRVIGRAGVGVDNVEVAEATRRGIIVVNAPQSNVVTAAEHTMAMLLSLARNIPQANAALHAGRWERSRWVGVELADKVLGLVGFGRIGQLVAARAKAFGMQVVAFDPFMSAERFAELGVLRAEQPRDLCGQADFLSLHLPNTPETTGWLSAETLGWCRAGIRVLNVARGALVDERALLAALESGHVAGAALDVFSQEPPTNRALVEHPSVICTPHLGASTGEATERAGLQIAEQVVAALTGGVVTSAVNAPAMAPDAADALSLYVPLCQQLGGLAMALTGAEGIEQIEIVVSGSLAEHDTRVLLLASVAGALGPISEANVNVVNAAALATERGIDLSLSTVSRGDYFEDEAAVVVHSGGSAQRVAGAIVGAGRQAQLTEVWGQRLTLPLKRYVALFRYRDKPGMLGVIGTALGRHGINIHSAVVSHGPMAVSVVTTDQLVSAEILTEIAAGHGVGNAHAVSLW